MKRLILSLLALVFAAFFAGRSLPKNRAAGPADGQPAPEFHLQDQKGTWHTLAQHHGKWIVLYFYPKDFTPGCTKEVCTFRDDVLRAAARPVPKCSASVSMT